MMSFKRTSCVLQGQTTMNSDLNTCDVVCLGRTNSEEGNTPPSDTSDDIPVETFHPCSSPNNTDEQFATILCSSASQSLGSDSTFVSVQEVGPLQKLVARDGSFAFEKSNTIQDKQLLVSRESVCTNLDLRSERNFETGIDNEQESVKKSVQNDCDRCYELQRISETKAAKIVELTKKLNELTDKHKMFIVSNCELNEENDCLKMQNQQLKLQIGKLTFENSQLRSENGHLLKQFAAKENPLLERSRISSSSSGPQNADASQPNSSKQCKASSSVIRDDLQEAILLSCQQKSDVQLLQERITHQNELIKTLCSQLQKMKGLGNLPPSLNQHGMNIMDVPQKDKLVPKGPQKQLNSESAAFHRQEDFTQVPKVGIDEDNDILLARDIADDEDLYSPGVFVHVPSASSGTKTQQRTHVVASNATFQSQSNDVEKRKAQDQQFKFDLAMGHNIQESLTNWHPNDAKVVVGLASPTENTTTRTEMPCVQKRLLHTEIVSCPFCGQEFLGSNADFQHNFETHMTNCTGLGAQQCPMCLKTLPGLSQAEFESHVNNHFVPEFEVLAP